MPDDLTSFAPELRRRALADAAGTESQESREAELATFLRGLADEVDAWRLHPRAFGYLQKRTLAFCTERSKGICTGEPTAAVDPDAFHDHCASQVRDEHVSWIRLRAFVSHSVDLNNLPLEGMIAHVSAVHDHFYGDSPIVPRLTPEEPASHARLWYEVLTTSVRDWDADLRQRLENCRTAVLLHLRKKKLVTIDPASGSKAKPTGRRRRPSVHLSLGLSSRQKQAYELRAQNRNWTRAQIAKEMGITTQRVGQLLQSADRKLDEEARRSRSVSARGRLPKDRRGGVDVE